VQDCDQASCLVPQIENSRGTRSDQLLSTQLLEEADFLDTQFTTKNTCRVQGLAGKNSQVLWPKATTTALYIPVNRAGGDSFDIEIGCSVMSKDCEDGGARLSEDLRDCFVSWLVRI
jgi:hypothetical protein